MNSDVSLIEIDLLRGGTPIAGGNYVTGKLDDIEPRPDYLVVLSRSWQRGLNLETELFPFTIRESLPCIPVPLREGENEVLLDLQYVFQLIYDNGPYRRGAVDYSQTPEPALSAEHSEWVAKLLLDRGITG